MKKTTLCILFVYFAFIQIHAANNDSYNWLHAKAFNGMNSTGMTVDSHNNTYFYGFSYSNVVYDGYSVTSEAVTDAGSIIVIKLNAQNEHQWTKKISVEKGRPNSSLSVRTMDVDNDGNMYFGGDFTNSVIVNSQTYDVGSTYGYFIMKTNAAGSIQWFKAGNSSYGSVHKIKYSLGRIGFVAAWSSSNENLMLFETDLMTKFGSLQHFSDCDMMVGALSANDGDIVFAQGIKTGQNRLTQQTYENNILRNPNTLDVDNAGNLYLSGGFSSNQLKVAGTVYNIATGLEAAESQFVLRVGTLGEISWVKIITNASGQYPSLAINSASGVAVLFNGGANAMKIGDEAVNVQGDATKMNHIALFSFTGDLKYKKMINSKTSQIATGPNGSFCVAGNLTSDGQYFGIDGLFNGESTQENLFVGFYDSELNSIAGQSVISEGMYMPATIKAGADGKIRLLGSINFETSASNVTYPFGDHVVERNQGDNKYVFSVLDPKPIIKAQIMAYGTGCGQYSINVNPNIKSKVQWYVNDVAKGTDFSLLGENQMGGYSFSAGISYIKVVLTDSTDATNTAEFRDTVTVYNPVVNINTQINPLTGVVNYSVVISNYAPTYNLYVDRGNYDSSTEPNGTYTYAPGIHTIKVSLSEMSNMNCFYHIEKSFLVPDPKSIITEECKNGAIKGKVESGLAAFLAGDVRVDLYGIANNGIHIALKSDTIDSNGEFKFEGLSPSKYKLRANILDASKYPTLLVTYFDSILNQVTSWQDANPITLTCNQWADLNLTFAAINAVLNGTGSISGIISYSDAPDLVAGKATIKASTQVGILMSNVPVVLRRKSNHEIVARTITDENGIYTFENLIDDVYEIVVEIPGVDMETTYDVTITESVDNVENRNFVVTNSGINTTPQLAIVATSTNNGTISSSGTTMLNAGDGKSYTITAANGFYIKDVLVNGLSVGAVSIYNFTNVNSNQTIHAIFDTTTGTKVNVLNKHSVYPAVFDNEIYVAGLNSKSKVVLINQLGVVQFVEVGGNSSNLTINTSQLSSGIYFVQIVSENSLTETFKLIKK